MTYITGSHIQRRTFLKGMGASVALPFLDAMVPAGRMASGAAANTDPARLVAIELVHGAAGCSEWGASQNLWDPAQVGRNFDLTPSALAPLDPWREHLTIVSNTDVRMAEAFEARLVEVETELSRDVSDALTVMYQDLQQERRDDLSLIGQLIVDGHRRDVIQGATDELFVATLATLSRAESSAEKGAIDEDL